MFKQYPSDMGFRLCVIGAGLLIAARAALAAAPAAPPQKIKKPVAQARVIKKAKKAR